MENALNSVKMRKPNRNFFDLSHDVKLTCKMGELVPILVQECIPGDKFRIGCRSLIRFAPMVAPVMHRINVTMHYFFVPNRLTWDGWEEWITGNTEEAPPQLAINAADYATHKRLLDYMGVPEITGGNVEAVNAFPFAAYRLIWREWYRDQNLQLDPLDPQLQTGFQVPNNIWLEMKKRCWEQDYFTACLPTPQKGDGVEIPIGTIQYDTHVARNSAAPTSGYGFWDWTDPAAQPSILRMVEDEGDNISGFEEGELIAKTSGLQVGATNITELRRAFKLQEWLERSIQAGGRYIEHIKAMFGVISDDARMQRPEYITGIKSPVIISEVLNTTQLAGQTPLGAMGGHGVSVPNANYGNYYCKEHGFIIGIMSVMPETGYFQGMPRHYGKRQDRFDYLWPTFAHIGEQAVEKKEIYVNALDGEATFGYIPRYQEYRITNNRVCGDFKGNMDFWHLARKFDAEPALNSEFVECNPSDRIFAVQDDADDLWCTVLNRIGVMRALPKYGEPFM